MCGDALTGYKALSSSRVVLVSLCSASLAVFIKFYHHLQTAQQAVQSSAKTCNTASTYT